MLDSLRPLVCIALVAGLTASCTDTPADPGFPDARTLDGAGDATVGDLPDRAVFDPSPDAGDEDTSDADAFVADAPTSDLSTGDATTPDTTTSDATTSDASGVDAAARDATLDTSAADISHPDLASDDASSDLATADLDVDPPTDGGLDVADDATPDMRDDADLSPSPDLFPDEPVNPYASGGLSTTRLDVEFVIEPPSGGPFGDPGVVFDLDVFVPEGTAVAPLLVFAPGFQLDRDNYRDLGQRAASHGIVVIIPTFGDGAFSAIDHSDLATYMGLFLDWALEQSASDDSALTGRLRSDWLAVGGHSRGGKVAYLTAIRDDRFDLVVTYDPVDSTGNPIFPPPPTPENPSVAPELIGDLTVPGLIFGAGRGAGGTVPCAPAEQNFEQYWSGIVSVPHYLYVLPDAGHLDFADDVGFVTDLGCVDGESPDETRAFAHAATIAFIRDQLMGDGRYTIYYDGSIVPAGTELRTR